MLERLLEVIGDSPFVDGLVMEAGEEESDFTLNEALQLMRSAHVLNDWILPFCHAISKEEATVIWRWAIGYYWTAYRNRFLKWIKIMSKLNGDFSVDVYFSVIFDGLQFRTTSNRSSGWSRGGWGQSDKWWFVSDCGTLKHVGDGVVRNRNGTLNTELTPLVDSDADCWIWENPLGYGLSPFNKRQTTLLIYKNAMDDKFHWHESQVLLDSYAKGGFLIAHETKSEYKETKKWDYYLLSKGSNTLYGQVMT